MVLFSLAVPERDGVTVTSVEVPTLKTNKESSLVEASLSKFPLTIAPLLSLPVKVRVT